MNNFPVFTSNTVNRNIKQINTSSLRSTINFSDIKDFPEFECTVSKVSHSQSSQYAFLYILLWMQNFFHNERWQNLGRWITVEQEALFWASSLNSLVQQGRVAGELWAQVEQGTEGAMANVLVWKFSLQTVQHVIRGQSSPTSPQHTACNPSRMSHWSLDSRF